MQRHPRTRSVRADLLALRLGRWFPWKIANIWKIFEVFVLCPECRPVADRRRVNDAVRQREGMACSLQGQRKIRVLEGMCG
jgi:hypothetical protein